jgi:AcrR family transcriptional regulator
MTTDHQKRKPSGRRRRYNNALRAEQAEMTQEKILEAAVEQITDTSSGQFSVERVAARAGVSSRTIYNHFPNREALFLALNSWIEERLNPNPMALPADAAELPPFIEALFKGFDESENFLRAQLLSGAGREVRSLVRTQRRAWLEQLIRSVPGEHSEQQVEETTAVVQYLLSSEAWRALKDESGMDGERAGRAVASAVRVLLAALQEKAQTTEGGGQ